MENTSTAYNSYVESGGGVSARGLLWLEPKDRATGTVTPMGFWTGADDLEFTIGGVTRLYYGAAGILGIDPILRQTGLSVQMQRITVAPITAELALAIRGYDTRLATVEIHRALFDTASGSLIEEPRRRFKGWCDTLTMTRSPTGGSYEASLQLASAARALTRALATKNSQAALSLRNPNDNGLRYASIAGQVQVKWGVE